MSGATRADAAHAARMDGVYALQRHVYDLTRKHYLLGRDRLIARLDPPIDGLVLEIGCGTARNLIHAARRYPSAQFYGIDISTEMLRTARSNVAGAGLRRRCRVAQADATSFSPQALFGHSRFDRVFCSYTLSMIPQWERALERACRLLAPGGTLHVVDFGQQDGLPPWFGRLLGAWLEKFHVAPRPDLFEVSGALAERYDMHCTCERLRRDYARAVVLRRA